MHVAHIDDDRLDALEAAGLNATMCRLSMLRDDHHTLVVAAPIFDGL